MTRALAAACVVLAACTYDYSKLRGSSAATPDAGVIDVETADGGSDAGNRLPLGAACGTSADCGSGNCVDGVCCNTACAGACVTCVAANSVGLCVPADSGTNPRGQCADQGAESCGDDGVCDGAGACERYAAGVVCAQAGCVGSTLQFASRCDGQGSCVGTPAEPCTPYVCGAAGQCNTTCATDSDCTAPSTCQNGSCGKKPIGAGCGGDADCNSGICAQGVCCVAPCAGTCRSCAVSGNAGSCTSVPAGQDPLEQCAAGDPTTCQTDGACDGAGACRLYAAGTVCGADACSAGTEMLAGRCDGKGACGAGSSLPCAPYACGPADCLNKCNADTDCAPGNVCTGGVCGKKVNGVACGQGGECASGFCVQGVCCNTSCGAACMACNLTGTVGTCAAVPNGTDPLGQCAVTDPTTCGTDGSCNGSGSCRVYASGTVCGAATCAGSTVTPAKRCDGAGRCAAATAQSCAPFVCGAGGSCLTACAANTDCVTPNVCTAGSCGKLPLGAACGSGGDCNSGFCAQGICCNTACAGTCQSCALASSIGTCTNVPAGQDPLSQCTDTGASSCGTDGFCNGAAACERYAAGTPCGPASCTGSTLKHAAACNAAGTCVAPASSSCGAFACDTGAGACKTKCASNADCTSPNVCNGGACTLQPVGTACTAAGQCASTFCQQGVCCSSSCTGTCMSCALAATPGTCTAVPAGQDPLNSCADGTSAKCGDDGFCDGAGKCRVYAAGTVCTPASCAATTLTPAATCDGAGACKAVTASSCAPFVCDTTSNACKTTCASNADCVAPDVCTNGSCGLLPLGAACAADTSCNAGHCQQGVCCATACTASCSSCAVPGNLGTCVAVPASGADPQLKCATTAAATCGTTGVCDGNGGCQMFASGTTCVAVSCDATTEVASPASTCDGKGTCVTPATVACAPYACGATACKTSCATAADCTSSALGCLLSVCVPNIFNLF